MHWCEGAPVAGGGCRPRRSQAWEGECLGTPQGTHTGHHACPLFGGAHTPAGLEAWLHRDLRQPPRGCPHLSLFLPGLTGPKIELTSRGFVALCPLNWEPCLLWEPRIYAVAGWGRGWMRMTTEALCFSAQTGPEVGGAHPRAQSPAQAGARGTHRLNPPWAGGLRPQGEGGEGPARQPQRQWLPATRLPPINSAAWREA